MSDLTVFQGYGTVPKNGIHTMADGGTRVFFDLNEMQPEELAKLIGFRGAGGYFIFSPKEVELNKLVLPDVAGFTKEEKSPSKRLRDVLYLYWKQLGSKGSSEEFYRHCIERIIEAYKEKLT